MIWHEKERVEEPGVLRHHADGLAWKDFDNKYPDFEAEPRNVRLGLAAEGFNPMEKKSLLYSMWPVVLTTYNLCPWLCMKSEYMVLTMFILGRKSPRKDMDVFLPPLIEELNELWQGDRL